MEIIIAIIFLFASFITGYILISRFFPHFDGLLRVSSAYIIGTSISIWMVFMLSLLMRKFAENALLFGFSAATTLLVIFVIHQRALLKTSLSIRMQYVLLVLIIFLFSFALFSRIFHYDQRLQEINISGRIWSDYGLHIPIIRSFSLGDNLALEHPLYAHESLHYHFLFDFMAGALERMRFPLDYALNLPSALSLTALLLLLYSLAKKLFWGSRFVGITTVTLFLFNSSLSFLEFLKKYPPDSFGQLISSWWRLRDFVVFGPWDGNIIGAFWNWNIYINQRQLIFGIALILLILNHYVYEYFEKDAESRKGSQSILYGRAIFIGAIIGLTVLWHSMSFISLFGIIGLLFIFFQERKQNLITLITAAVIALPQILWLTKSSSNMETYFSLHIGYLAADYIVPISLTSVQFINQGISYFISFLRYWFFNIGLNLLIIPAAIFFIDRKRKMLLMIFTSIFILGNLFQFSPEIGANHKFFNIWLILADMFAAYVLYRIFARGWRGRVIAASLLILLTLSGVIDIAPIKNDSIYTVSENTPIINWIKENTDPLAVFLTTVRIYNPVSFTGRKSMIGWPYFAWSAGLNQPNREKIARAIFEANSVSEVCGLLKENRVDYVMTEKQVNNNSPFTINHEFFNSNFKPVFFDPSSAFEERIFTTQKMCGGQ